MKLNGQFIAVLFSAFCSCAEQFDEPTGLASIVFVNETTGTVRLADHLKSPSQIGYYSLLDEELLPADSLTLFIESDLPGGVLALESYGDSLTIESDSLGCRSFLRYFTRDERIPCCGEGPYRWDDYVLRGERVISGRTVEEFIYTINASTFEQGEPCP